LRSQKLLLATDCERTQFVSKATRSMCLASLADRLLDVASRRSIHPNRHIPDESASITIALGPPQPWLELRKSLQVPQGPTVLPLLRQDANAVAQRIDRAWIEQQKSIEHR